MSKSDIWPELDPKDCTCKKCTEKRMNSTDELRELKPGTSEYVAIHHWVSKEWGKPDYCEHCDKPTSKRFEWANLSGKYLKDRSDWARLCASCHRKYDQRDTHCPKGHEYTPENSYTPSTKPNQRRCRQCNREAVSAHFLSGKGREAQRKRRQKELNK